MKLSERIDKIIEYSGMSLPKYAQAIGAQTPQAIRDLKNGKTKSLSADMQTKILSYMPELSPAWLLANEGEMLKKESSAKMLGEAYAFTQGDDNVAMVDYIPSTATATFIEYIGDGNPELDKIAVIKQYGETLDRSYKVFEVIGDSMSPGIPNRAKILTKEIPEQKWGLAEGVVVVVFDDEIVVKRIINNNLNINNSLHLISDNPKCGGKTIALADIRAMYKAIRIISADIL